MIAIISPGLVNGFYRFDLVLQSPWWPTASWSLIVISTILDAGQLALRPSEAAKVSNSIRPSARLGIPS